MFMPTSRNTIQKQLVLSAVQALRNHPTAEDIYTYVSRQHPTISKATVYRNLGQLAQQGAVRRVSHLNAADRFDFELRPHYHCRCRVCNSVFDVDIPQQENLLARVNAPGGFLLEGYEISFTGICSHCQQNQGPAQ